MRDLLHKARTVALWVAGSFLTGSIIGILYARYCMWLIEVNR